MQQSNMIEIEVAFADVLRQKVYLLRVAAGTTIQDAIALSPLYTDFPEIDFTQYKVGIFSKRKELTDVVQDGDRVEIYRPLIIDPKEARRAKAKQKSR